MSLALRMLGKKSGEYLSFFLLSLTIFPALAHAQGGIPSWVVPNVSVSWDKAEVDFGGSATFSWSATDTSGCTLNKGGTYSQVAMSGSVVVNNIETNLTYSVVCSALTSYADKPSDSDSATITVNLPALNSTGNLSPSRLANQYDVYLGDINSDGRPDVYLHGKQWFIPIHSDILIPVVLEAPLSHQVVAVPDTVQRQAPGGSSTDTIDIDIERYSSAVGISSLTESQISTLGLVKLTLNQDYYVGDFNGDALGDILIRVDHGSSYLTAAIMLTGRHGVGTANNWMDVAYTFQPNGQGASNYYGVINRPGFSFLAHHNFFDSSVSFEVRDINNDGKDEIYIGGDHVSADIFYNVASYNASASYITSPATIRAASLNGASTGSFRVDERGAATYSIPITIPSGTAGSAPELSLNYSSQGSNGIWGYGWNLKGISAINRCRKTNAQDGTTSAVMWDSSDPLCIDGQRLVLTKTNASSREYSTDIADYRRVTSYGDVNNPSYFTVESKDGSISYYGNSADSKQSGLGAATYQWTLKEYRDSANNKIVYGYLDSTNGDMRLDTIKYAYGSSDTIHNAEIKFNYQSRLDDRTIYVSGKEYKLSLRLSDIQVSSRVVPTDELKEIRNYILHYDRNTPLDHFNRSYVTSIQECVGSQCLPATKFNWEKDHSLAFGTAEWTSEWVIQNKSDLLQTLPMDIDGDGYLDIVWSSSDEFQGDHSTVIQYALYNKSTGKYSSPKNFSGAPKNCHSDTKYDEIDLCDDKDKLDRQVVLQPIDYNGDGRQDLAVYRHSQDAWYIYPSVVGTSGTWALASQYQQEIKIGRTANNEAITSMFVDVNGDGLQDIVTQTKIYYLDFKSNATDIESFPYEYKAPVAYSLNWQTTKRLFDSPYDDGVDYYQQEYIGSGDFNGDGTADLILADRRLRVDFTYDVDNNPQDPPIGPTKVLFRHEHYYIAYGSGAGFKVKDYLGGVYKYGSQDKYGRSPGHWLYTSGLQYSNTTDIEPLVPLTDFKIADINGDGLSDYLEPTALGSTSYKVLLNTGTGFKHTSTLSNLDFATTESRLSNVTLQDVNSDGSPDVLLTEDGSSLIYYHPWNSATESFDARKTLDGASVNYDSSARTMVFDITGDGRSDIFIFDRKKFGIRKNTKTGHQSLVTQVVNGLGGVTDITYEYLINSNHYKSYDNGLISVIPWQGYCYNPYQTGTTHVECPDIVSFDKNEFYRRVNRPFSYLSGHDSLEKMDTRPKTPVFDYVAPLPLVTRVDGSAPSGSELSAGSVTTSTKAAIEYYYQWGRMQMAGRGFLGFQAVTTVDMQSKVSTTSEYRQDWPFVGIPLRTTAVAESGDVLSKSESYWSLVGWNPTWKDSYRASNSGTSVLPLMKPYTKTSSEIKYKFNTSAADPTQVVSAGTNEILQESTTEQVFDEYGNPVKVTTTSGDASNTLIKTIFNDYEGDGDFTAGNSTPLSITFNNTNTGASRTWNATALGRLFHTRVETKLNAEPVTKRFSSFKYYGVDGVVGGGTVKSGLIYKEIIEPKTANDLPDLTSIDTLIADAENPANLITTYDYDSFGNKNSAQVEGYTYEYGAIEGDEYTGASGKGGADVTSIKQTRKTEYFYDPLGRYLNTTRTYKNGTDYFDGDVVDTRNIYGSPTLIKSSLTQLQTVIDYDVLGREIGRSDNTGAWADTEYLKPGQVSDSPAGTSFVVRKTVSGGGLSLDYYDVLGRVTRTATKTLDGTLSFVDSEFDVSGRGLRTSEPYFKGNTQYWTRNYYDAFGRVIKTELPWLDTANIPVQTFRYNGNEIVSTNAKGQSKTEIKNGLGQLTEVRDPDGGKITYHYDSRGNMTEVRTYTSASSTAYESSVITFDKLGRKISMDDPDKGYWEYRYNGFGDVVWQKDAKGQVVTQSYDNLGRMKNRVDYKLVLDTVDSKNKYQVENHTSWYYDGYTDVANTTTHAGFVPYAGTQPSAVVMTDSISASSCTAQNAKHCSYPAYDVYGRPHISTVKYVIDGQVEEYSTGTLYDNLGRIDVVTDVLDGAIKNTAGSFISSGIRNHYHPATGYLEWVEDLNSLTSVYQVITTNARGQVTKAGRGNSIIQEFQYNEATGQLEHQFAYQGTNYFHDITYAWDELGNLSSRYNNSLIDGNGTRRNYEESFCYDGLNRLIKTYSGTVNSTSTAACANLAVNDGVGSTSSTEQDLNYDGRGNILYKKGVGSYDYTSTLYSGNSGPHAVAKITNGTEILEFKYDQNGNVVEDRKNGIVERQFSYTTFDKPDLISKGGTSSEFKYGIDRSRYWRQDIVVDDSGNSSIKTTRYLGSVEKITTNTSNDIQWKRYLGKSAIVTITTGGLISDTTGSYYQQLAGNAGYEELQVFNDHLGSLDILFNPHVATNDSLVQSMSFNEWGERRNVATGNIERATDFSGTALLTWVTALNSKTTRGFTGHEMIDALGIIHMNGRIYDARIARFLQADPIIQAATNTQSFNRYSYVWNNPLNATDPSGYETHWNQVQRGFRQVVGIVIVAVASWYCAGTCSAPLYMAVMGMAAAVSAAINGANSQGILKAAVIGAATAYLGAVTEGLTRVAVMAVAGGITSVINGGEFGHGFLSAGIGALAGGYMPEGANYAPLRVGVSAMIGGTSSAASGGKFENGAASAALSAAVGEGLGGAKSQSDGESKHSDDNASVQGEIASGAPNPKTTSDEVIVNPDLVKNKNVTVTVDGDGNRTIHITGAVASEKKLGFFTKGKFKNAVKGMNKLNGMSVANSDETITLNVNITVIDDPTKADWIISLKGSKNQAPVGKSGPGNLPISLGGKLNKWTAAHELLHTIGLRHQENWTSAITSYNFSPQGKDYRGLTYSEARRIADNY